MNTERYRFKVGVFECIVVSDGTFAYPHPARLFFAKAETEIVPGIRFIAAPGHTPGHMAVAVASEGAHLVHLVDAVIHPIHLGHPDWYSLFDLLPEQTIATRRRLLEQVAAEQVLVLTHHFNFPCLGYVIREKKAWRWQPVDVEGAT